MGEHDDGNAQECRERREVRVQVPAVAEPLDPEDLARQRQVAVKDRARLRVVDVAEQPLVPKEVAGPGGDHPHEDDRGGDAADRPRDGEARGGRSLCARR